MIAMSFAMSSMAADDGLLRAFGLAPGQSGPLRAEVWSTLETMIQDARAGERACQEQMERRTEANANDSERASILNNLRRNLRSYFSEISSGEPSGYTDLILNSLAGTMVISNGYHFLNENSLRLFYGLPTRSSESRPAEDPLLRMASPSHFREPDRIERREMMIARAIADRELGIWRTELQVLERMHDILRTQENPQIHNGITTTLHGSTSVRMLLVRYSLILDEIRFFDDKAVRAWAEYCANYFSYLRLREYPDYEREHGSSQLSPLLDVRERRMRQSRMALERILAQMDERFYEMEQIVEAFNSIGLGNVFVFRFSDLQSFSQMRNVHAAFERLQPHLRPRQD